MNIRKIWIGAVAAALLTIGLPAAAADVAEQAPKLEQRAEAAATAAEQAEVAKQYRLRAETFEAKAVEHEAKAAELASRYKIGMTRKWPAMSSLSPQRQRSLAMEARRASNEAYTLANKHTQLAVEAGFTGSELAQAESEETFQAENR